MTVAMGQERERGDDTTGMIRRHLRVSGPAFSAAVT